MSQWILHLRSQSFTWYQFCNESLFDTEAANIYSLELLWEWVLSHSRKEVWNSISSVFLHVTLSECACAWAGGHILCTCLITVWFAHSFSCHFCPIQNSAWCLIWKQVIWGFLLCTKKRFGEFFRLGESLGLSMECVEVHVRIYLYLVYIQWGK